MHILTTALCIISVVLIRRIHLKSRASLVSDNFLYFYDLNPLIPRSEKVLISLYNLSPESNVNPFNPTSDQERISPYNINTISSRQVMRIEKNINYGIIS